MQINSKVSLILSILILVFTTQSHAKILFADNFDNSTDWDGRINSISQITSTTVGHWANIWPSPQSDARHGEIAAAHGHAGKGFRFSLESSGGSTQESCLFGSATLSEPTLFWGYWFKVSNINWGTGGKTLKMARFYPSPGSSGQSIIPGFQEGPSTLKIYYDGQYRPYPGIVYNLSDTNWHSYIWEFQRGNNSGDGIIRLWVDGTLIYQNTTVNWNGTGTNFTFNSFPMMQGNLSGNYTGGVLYTYWDNYIWATTLDEVKSFLGAGSTTPPASDHTSPSSPSGINVQIIQ